MAASEIVLTALPATSEKERVLVVLLQQPGEPSRVELRQQSFGEGIGWFTQSTVHLEPSQLADLRNALGFNAPAPRRAKLPREFSKVAPQSWQPRVVAADAS